VKAIRGRKALVTGAATGVGRAIALALAREGADLYLIDIDARRLEIAAVEARRHGVEVVTRICDLRQDHEIGAAVADMLARWKGLDILVNNAGIAHYGPTHLMTAAQWRDIVAVNLTAPISLVHALLPILLAQDEAHILNVSSVLGLVTQQKVAAYQATKFGLVGFSLALRAEYSGRGIGVTALCPGPARTAMLEEVESERPDKPLPLPPAWLMTTPDHIAACAIAAIHRDRRIVVVSPLAKLLWWLMRLTPGVIDWISREGWRRRRKIDVAADLAAQDCASAAPPSAKQM
jgi:short-subunit dehydrogenase